MILNRLMLVSFQRATNERVLGLYYAALYTASTWRSVWCSSGSAVQRLEGAAQILRPICNNFDLITNPKEFFSRSTTVYYISDRQQLTENGNGAREDIPVST